MRLKNGSALLLVLVISSILSLLSLGLWHKTSLMLDLVLQEEQYYKNFYLTESFLNYGVQIAMEGYQDFFTQKNLVRKPIIITVNLDNDLDKSFESLLVEITVKRLTVKDKLEEKLYISAVLKNAINLRQLFKLSCKLCRYEAKSEYKDSKKRMDFFVENFTIGNFI